MSIGIVTHSIIMDVSFVIETAKRHFVYFIATKLMFLAFLLFSFCGAFARYSLTYFYSLHV